MRLPFRERKSSVTPLLLRYTRPVNGSSSSEPIEWTGKLRALAWASQLAVIQPSRGEGRSTYSQGVDHGLEAHVDLSAADDLGHIGRVVGLQESDLEVLVLEVTLGLSEVQRGMVRGRVPSHV